MNYTYDDIQPLLSVHTIVSNISESQVSNIEQMLISLATKNGDITVDDLKELPFYSKSTLGYSFENSNFNSEFSLNFTKEDIVKFIIILLININETHKEKLEDSYYGQIEKIDIEFKLVIKSCGYNFEHAEVRKILYSPIKKGFTDYLNKYRESYEIAKKNNTAKYKEGVSKLFQENLTLLNKDELLQNINFMEQSDNDEEYFVFKESMLKKYYNSKTN